MNISDSGEIVGNQDNKDKSARGWVRNTFDYLILILVIIVTAVVSFFISNQFEVYKVSGESMKPTIEDGSRLLISLDVVDNLGRDSGNTEKYERGDIIVFDSNKKSGNLDQYYLEGGQSFPADIESTEDVDGLLSTEDGKEYLYDKYSEGDYIVKRVIGIPGDSVSYNGREYKINGEVIESDNAYLGYNNGVITGGHRIEKDNNVMSQVSENDANLILNESWNLEESKIPDNKYLVMGDNRSNSNDSRLFGLVDIYSIEGEVLASFGNSFEVFK